MKKPARVQIGGIQYTVHLVPELRDVNTEDRDLLLGQFKQLTAEIRVFHGGSAELARQTFLHEALHGVVEAYGIRELNVDGCHLETPINQLSLGLSEILNSLGIDILEKLK